MRDSRDRRPGQRAWRALLLLPLLLLGQPAPATADDRLCFAESGVCLAGRFLDYWRAHGGLAVFGYPIAPEQPEKLADHQVHTVQYFERARFEQHPGHAPPYDVLLGQLGRYHHTPDPPAPPRADALYFPETGHSVGGAFRAFWEAHGGLATLGYPLSEERQQATGLATTMTVQWFERARLEDHPEHAGTPYAVQPSRLGAQMLGAREARGGPEVPRRPGLFAPDEPAFTEQDVRQFLEDWWAAHPPPPPPGPGTPVRSMPPPLLPPRGTIAAVEFLTSYAAQQRVPGWQSFADEQLLCLVTLQYPGRARPTYLFLDAHLGAPRGSIGG